MVSAIKESLIAGAVLTMLLFCIPGTNVTRWYYVILIYLLLAVAWYLEVIRRKSIDKKVKTNQEFVNNSK